MGRKWKNLYPMDIEPFTVIDLAERGPKAHYLRYGHSALAVAAGMEDTNCDGHSHSLPGLKEDMLKSLMEPIQGENVVYGIFSIGNWGFEHMIDKLTPVLDALPKSIKWHSGDPYYPSITEGYAHEYLNFLKKHRVAIVAPPHCERLRENADFHPVLHIPTGKNCYNQKAEILQEIIKIKDEVDIVLFACSVLAEPLIHELHRPFMDKGLVDVGAFLDPISGVRSRGYARSLSDEFIKKSYGINKP